MATLIKEHEGLIYDERFNENSLIWSLTPSNIDCLRFNPDGLHIIHNDHYVSYTMKELLDTYCLVTQLDHVPLTEEDIGGIIILSDNNTYAECQTYLAQAPSTIDNDGKNVSPGYDLSARYTRYSFDDEDESDESDSSSSSDATTVINPTTGFKDIVYQYLKMIKYSNSSHKPTYQFFASPNGYDWIEVGNVDYDNNNNSIGFFLYATNDEDLMRDGKFLVNYFYIYENKYLTLNGINYLQDFEIYEPNLNKILMRSDTTPGKNYVNRYKNRAIIDTTGLVLPMNNAELRIYPKNHYEETISRFTLSNLTFGGDIFSITYDIQLRIDNEIVNNGIDYELGDLFNNKYRRNVVVYNNEDFEFRDIKVSIKAFSEYFSGEEVVQIAFYDHRYLLEANPHDQDDKYLNGDFYSLYNEIEFSDSLTISSLPPHSGVELIIKLSERPKQEFYSVANKYKFKLLIE